MRQLLSHFKHFVKQFLRSVALSATGHKMKVILREQRDQTSLHVAIQGHFGLE